MTASADFVLPDNTEIQGALCVGSGGQCANGEFFGSDLKIKSSAPHLRFETTAPVRAQTWDIFANESSFLVFDATFVNVPFSIQLGASTNSLHILSDDTVQLGGPGFEAPSTQGKLHIFGDATQDVVSGIGPDPDSVDTGTALNFGYSGHSFGNGSGFFNVRPAPGAVAPNPSLRFATANVQRVIIDNLGNVGIGDFGATVGNPGTSPLDKLHVQGNVRADGNFIANGTTLTVPDYVFEPGYQLMPLPQLARYVEHEKHLPDIPSAQELKTQGVNISEMQMQLLKKIEELTLYTVQQEKTIAALTEALTKVQARLAVLEHRH